jgi:hypothetical protein
VDHLALIQELTKNEISITPDRLWLAEHTLVVVIQALGRLQFTRKIGIEAIIEK